MKKILLREAAKHKLQNRRQKRWQKTVSILACLVVFCTVYALILPALTAEADTYCGKEEHTHTEDCYQDKLICGQEEGQGAHHHTDDCYREVKALVCPTPESDGHQHTEACYTEKQVLTSTNTEEDHVHSEFDDCYTTEKELTCGIQEGEGAHHHTAECYEIQKELICGQEENDGHHHTAECYEKELICGKEEHTHTLACYSNPNADVENGDVWQNTVSSVTLTGNWGADLAAIAQTQTGYTESTANYAVAEDGQTIHGYTRYGAWANDPYRDNWSAQFADFCLSYAGVPTSAVPQNSDCSAWNYTIPDGYTPKTGDLLLLDTDNNGSADHAGIVITADDSTLTAIVGDADKTVKNNTYNIGSENIKGYVSIPENPALADDNNEEETTETTPAPEVTEEPQETPAPEVTPEAEPTQEPEITPEAEPIQTPETTPEVTEEPTQKPENKADDAADNKADENKTQDEDVKEDDSKKDDTANNIEVTPTPIPTPELAENQFAATLYTDSSYSAEMENQTPITVSGQLPVNAEVKAYPVENLSMENEEILYAWDISIFDENGNLWEPENGNAISVEFQIPEETEEDSSYSIYYVPEAGTEQKPEEVASQISGDAISFEAEHFSVYALVRKARTVTNGLDFEKYITNVVLQKKDGVIWKDCEEFEFTTSDQMRAKFHFEEIPTENLKNNGNMGYILLPEGFDCSHFANQTYNLNDNGQYAGTYTFEKDSDGRWRIKLNIDQTYINNAGATIGGNVEFEYQWDSKSSSEEGKTETIVIGQWTGTVTIKNDKKDDSGETSVNYTIKKEQGGFTYDATAKKGYISYTVTLTVNKDHTGDLTLKDILSGKGFDFDKNSLKITSQEGVALPHISFENSTKDANGAKTDIKISTEQGMVAAGTYTITYRVECKQDTISEGVISDKVTNKVELPDGDKTVDSSTETKTTIKPIDKQGKLVEENGDIYIDYTVYINAGDIVKPLTEGAKFEDTLPDKLEFVGDITVKQYDVSGKECQSNNITPTGKTISYTTPTGQYFYVITYRTKVIDKTTIPIGGENVSNTGKTTGGITGTDTETVTLPNHILSKKFENQKVSQTQDGKWVNTMNWESTINVNGSLKDFIYEDWAETIWSDKQKQHICPTSMSEEQRNKIEIFDAQGNKITGGYITDKSDHTDNNVKNGLFKITFTDDITGPVTIKYETTADLEEYAVGGWMQFTNHASITKDGHTDFAQAVTDNIKYNHTFPGIIRKCREGEEGGDKISTIIAPGETTIPWTIIVNNDKKMQGDFVVTDTIADGMTFIEDSLEIRLWDHSIKNNDGVEWNYKGGKLTVTVKERAYCPSGNSSPIVISYRTELPKDYLKDPNLSRTFTNTASVEQNGQITDSTFSQEVTRRVIGKSGKYDTSTGILSYEIILNPEATRLNEGKTLTVVDTLGNSEIKQYIQLQNLTLYTAVKTTGSDGSTKVVPGKFIKKLTKDDSQEIYHYSWDSVNGRFTTYIPDESAYVLVAEYSIEKEVSQDISISNSVELQGMNKWDASDNSTTVKKSTDGSLHTNDSIVVEKHDASQYNNLLNNATFSLEEYVSATMQWKLTATLITGKNQDNTDGAQGKATISVDRNKLYRLTETVAPTEYILDSTPYYFMVVKKGEAAILPESIAGDAAYDKNKVVIYTVDQYSRIVIERFNDRDTTIIKPGQLRVTKEWVNGDSPITDSEQLSKMPEVNVTLTMYEKVRGHSVKIVDNSGNVKEISDINDGGYIYFKGWENAIKANWENALSGTGVSISLEKNDPKDGIHIWKIGPITEDLRLQSHNLYYGCGEYLKMDGGNPAQGETEKKKWSIVLNNDNDWTYLWTNLKAEDGISYILTEETVDGYKTTYTLNGTELTQDNLKFSLNTSGDKMVVTNTADKSQDYILPETGGIGTNRFTAMGLALMAGSLMCGYVMRRKRREGRRN